jgi:hypothetical protein
MRELLTVVRKEAGEAKSFAVQLDGKELSDELMVQMNKHSRLLYAMAKKLDEMVSSGVEDMESYKPYLNRLDALQTWYQPRAKSAKGLLRPFMSASKGKAKAKAQAEKPAADLD